MRQKIKDAAKEKANDELYVNIALLIQLCGEMLCEGKTTESWNTCSDILETVKKVWYKQRVAVIVTTISKLNESIIKDFEASWAILEEAQYVSDHNVTPFLVAFHDIPKYLVGDPRQLSPYIADSDQNAFAMIRMNSCFTKCIKRGYRRVQMTISNRCGPLAIQLTSDMCYKGLLTSGIPNHPRTQSIMAFHRDVFKSEARVPHLFVDTGAGEAIAVGHRRSTMNPGLMDYTKAYITAYVEYSEKHKYKDIGVIAPWKMQGIA